MAEESQENYYQTLGVQPNASQEVLDAAYRRQVRLHTGEYLDDAALVAGPEPSDPFLARVDRAYRQLSNPLRRWTHDEALKEAQLAPLSEEDLERARKRIEPSDSWLSYQRLENGSLYIRVGWAEDFSAVHKAVSESIPEVGRAYNARLNEWRIDPIYEEKLAEIFTNFRRSDVQAPPPQVGPVYPGLAFFPRKQRSSRSWSWWPYLVIGGLVAAIVGAVLFPANRVDSISVQATATAFALLSSYEPLATAFPEDPQDTESPAGTLTATLIHPSVNLRHRPEIDAPILRLLTSNDKYEVVGRLANGSWYLVRDDLSDGWIAAWTVSLDGEPSSLPVYVESAASD